MNKIVMWSIISIIIISIIVWKYDTIYFALWHTFINKPNDKILLENLELFKYCMDTCNIFFWIGEGTALGCVRDHNIIKNDSDVDVGVWYKDKEKFLTTCIDMLKEHGFKIGRRYPFSIYRKRNYIDIDFTGRGHKCMAACDPGGCMRKCEILLDTLKPFQYLEMKGNMYNVPSMKYIEKLYGKEWYIPVPKKTISKKLLIMIIIIVFVISCILVFYLSKKVINKKY